MGIKAGKRLVVLALGQQTNTPFILLEIQSKRKVLTLRALAKSEAVGCAVLY